MENNSKTPHEMLLDKGFKGMRPNRDINIAAIVAEEYAQQENSAFAAAFFKWTNEEGKDLVKSLTMTGPMLVEAYKKYLTTKK